MGFALLSVTYYDAAEAESVEFVWTTHFSVSRKKCCGRQVFPLSSQKKMHLLNALNVARRLPNCPVYPTTTPIPTAPTRAPLPDPTFTPDGFVECVLVSGFTQACQSSGGCFAGQPLEGYNFDGSFVSVRNVCLTGVFGMHSQEARCGFLFSDN